jgi:hypothetical protein
MTCQRGGAKSNARWYSMDHGAAGAFLIDPAGPDHPELQ